MTDEHRGTREPPDGDDRERRDDTLDQAFLHLAASVNSSVAALSSAVNALIMREQEQYNERTERDREEYRLSRRQAEELFHLRQTSRDHQAHLSLQGLTGNQAAQASNVIGTAAIGEEQAENVTDAPDTGTELPKA